MKKIGVSVLASLLVVSLLLSGCSKEDASSVASSGEVDTSSVASLEETPGTDEVSSEAEVTDESMVEDASSITTTASSGAATTTTSSKASTATNPTSSKAAAATTPEKKTEAYVRFKLTGGDPSIERMLITDMDGLGFIGSCPQSYLNTQTNETIKNAEWKSDSKFRNYYHQLHSATKIFFDGSEDVEFLEEKSTLLKAELPMTVAAWIKPDGTYKPEGSPDFRVIASYGSNNGIREHWDFKLLSDNSLSFFSADIPSEARTGLDSDYKVPNDVWTHVAVQVSKTDVVYYANGKKVYSVKLSSPITNDTNALGKRNFAIGSLIEGAYSLRGGIAELGIYKGLVDPKDTTSVKF